MGLKLFHPEIIVANERVKQKRESRMSTFADLVRLHNGASGQILQVCVNIISWHNHSSKSVLQQYINRCICFTANVPFVFTNHTTMKRPNSSRRNFIKKLAGTALASGFGPTMLSAH